jgi:hypothetical protein
MRDMAGSDAARRAARLFYDAVLVAHKELDRMVEERTGGAPSAS